MTRSPLRRLTPVLLVMTLSACTFGGRLGHGEAADGGVRPSNEGVTPRFPALGSPSPVTWMADSLGGGRFPIPGPTTLWIDAVVVLEPEAADKLRAASGTLTPVALPDVRSELAASIPAGQPLGSERLDRQLGTGDWVVRAVWIQGTTTLVLTAQLPGKR